MEYRTSIGLDVHARTVAAAAFVPETGEVVERSFGCEAVEIAGWAASLPQPARAVYESGPTGSTPREAVRDPLYPLTKRIAYQPSSPT